MFPALDPDDVYALKTFDTVINFLVLDKEQREFDERYKELAKIYNV